MSTQQQDKPVCHMWSEGHIWERTRPLGHIRPQAWLPPGLDCKTLIRGNLWKLCDSDWKSAHTTLREFPSSSVKQINIHRMREDGKSGDWSGFQTAPCRPVNHQRATRQAGACGGLLAGGLLEAQLTTVIKYLQTFNVVCYCIFREDMGGGLTYDEF